MLGARIDIIQRQITNFIAYRAANARQKTMTAVVKRDKTSGLDRNDRQKCLRCSAHFLSENVQ